MKYIKMSSYPDELTFGAKAISGFSKNTVKLSTQTLLDATPGDQIIFELPSNQLVDLRTFSIHFDLVGLATTSKHCVLPRDTNSFIDSVVVEINGTVVDGSCTGYAHMAKIFTDFTFENRKTGRSVLNLTRDYPGGTLLTPQEVLPGLVSHLPARLKLSGKPRVRSLPFRMYVPVTRMVMQQPGTTSLASLDAARSWTPASLGQLR
jgi:hypothetical protein